VWRRPHGGYVSIRRWEASSELPYREQGRDMAAGERFPTTRRVDTHILGLRRKFEADADRPAWILTLPGHGYKFAAV
jgi:DNA-binding response OmpR family regulator